MKKTFFVLLFTIVAQLTTPILAIKGLRPGSTLHTYIKNKLTARLNSLQQERKIEMQSLSEKKLSNNKPSVQANSNTSKPTPSTQRPFY